MTSAEILSYFTLVLDVALTFQEFEVLRLSLNKPLDSICSDRTRITVLADTGRVFIRNAWLRSGDDVAAVTAKAFEGLVAESKRDSVGDVSMNALVQTVANPLNGLSERFFKLNALLVTSGRRGGEKISRNTLIRLARQGISLFIFRVAGDSRELCSNDDELRCACSQTPGGRFYVLNPTDSYDLGDAVAAPASAPPEYAPSGGGKSSPPPGSSSGIGSNLPVLQEPEYALKLIEYDLPFHSVYHREQLIDARRREGFVIIKADVSRRKRRGSYNNTPGVLIAESSCQLRWSLRAILEYLVKIDVDKSKIKCQFRLRGPLAVLKILETNAEMIRYIGEATETDVIISHLCGSKADTAMRYLLSTQPLSVLERYLKMESIVALCAPSLEAEIQAQFPRASEWIVPKRLVRITFPYMEYDRTMSKLQENRKLLVIPPGRMDQSYLFDPNAADVTRVTRPLRMCQGEDADSKQEAVSTLSQLWKRRGFFQLAPFGEDAVLDLILLTEDLAQPCVRFMAQMVEGFTLVATIVIEGENADATRWSDLLKEDEQVLSRLQLFADLRSVQELLPFSRRNQTLDFKYCQSLLSGDSAIALNAAVGDVFPVMVPNDFCRARYLSKDVLVVFVPAENKLFEIRRADLLPPTLGSSQSSGIHSGTAAPTIGGGVSMGGDDESGYLAQLAGLLRQGYARGVAQMMHQKRVQLQSEEDVQWITEGCAQSFADVDFSKLAVLGVVPDDFGAKFEHVVLKTCGLSALNESSSIFASNDGFFRFYLCHGPEGTTSITTAATVVTLASSLQNFRDALLKPDVSTAYLRIYVYTPAYLTLGPSHRMSGFPGSSSKETQTMMSLEKEIGLLASVAVLQYARRILPSRPDTAIQLVRETMSRVSECVRLEIDNTSFVQSSSFEEEEKIDLFAKELLAQQDFVVRSISSPLASLGPPTYAAAVATSAPSSLSSSSASNKPYVFCHSDEDCWCILTLTIATVQVVIWSFSDPLAQTATALVTGCVARVKRRTNQIILLTDLHDTRLAPAQLIPSTVTEYPFFTCPSQHRVEISLGRWVTKEKLMKELASSPVFFIRNRSNWFVYRALNNKIAYFSPIASSSPSSSSFEDPEDRRFVLDMFAVDPLTQNALDHLQKILKELVLELSIEALTSFVKQYQHHRFSQQQSTSSFPSSPLPVRSTLDASSLELEQLISDETGAGGNKHYHEFVCAERDVTRHLNHHLRAHLVIARAPSSTSGGTRSSTQTQQQQHHSVFWAMQRKSSSLSAVGAGGEVPESLLVRPSVNSALDREGRHLLLSLIENILIISKFEEDQQLSRTVIKVNVWIPTRRGNAAKAYQSFLTGFQETLKLAERSASFESRVQNDGFKDFQALVDAARDACGSTTVSSLDYSCTVTFPIKPPALVLLDSLLPSRVKTPISSGGGGGGTANASQEASAAGTPARVSSAGPPAGTDFGTPLPRWTMLYALKDLERRARIVFEDCFKAVYSFRTYAKRSSSGNGSSDLLDWTLLQPDDEERILLLQTPTQADESSPPAQSPLEAESLGFVFATRPFWIKRVPSVAVAEGQQQQQPDLKAEQENTHATTTDEDESNDLQILLVIIRSDRIEVIAFALEESDVATFATEVQSSSKWLRLRVQAFSSPALRKLAAFGKKRTNFSSPTVAVRAMSISVSSNASASSPRASSLEQSQLRQLLKKQDSQLDPAQEVARWTQDRRGLLSSGALRSAAEIGRVLQSCRPVMSLRVPELCHLPLGPLPSLTLSTMNGNRKQQPVDGNVLATTTQIPMSSSPMQQRRLSSLQSTSPSLRPTPASPPLVSFVHALLKACGKVLEQELRMSPIGESSDTHYYFSIFGGTHLFLACVGINPLSVADKGFSGSPHLHFGPGNSLGTSPKPSRPSILSPTTSPLSQQRKRYVSPVNTSHSIPPGSGGAGGGGGGSLSSNPLLSPSGGSAAHHTMFPSIGPVVIDLYVRELGKHSGGVSLSLAQANLHVTVPLIRATIHDFYVEKISSLILRDRLSPAIQTAMDFGRLVRAEEWDATMGITSVQIVCEARHIVLGDEGLEEWNKALFERGDQGNLTNFVLGPALVHREETFDCLLQIIRVAPAPPQQQQQQQMLSGSSNNNPSIPQAQLQQQKSARSPPGPVVPNGNSGVVVVHAELCVLCKQRNQLPRSVHQATYWAKARIERCAGDVRWCLFWRQVKRSSYRGELHSFVFEEDIIGEQARVSLTMIDSRFDDLLSCIEHNINWLGPLQRMLSTQPSWLIATVRTRTAGGGVNGLLITRENCVDRFAVFAVAEDGEKSMLFDLFYRVDSDVRKRHPELEEMLSLLLRTLGALFLDSCIMRVADCFEKVGLGTTTNDEDGDNDNFSGGEDVRRRGAVLSSATDDGEFEHNDQS